MKTAFIQMTIRTFFEDGTYRNNTVMVEIPREAADLIYKHWAEKGSYNCINARFLASNQVAGCLLFDKDDSSLELYVLKVYKENS